MSKSVYTLVLAFETVKNGNVHLLTGSYQTQKREKTEAEIRKEKQKKFFFPLPVKTTQSYTHAKTTSQIIPSKSPEHLLSAKVQAVRDLLKNIRPNDTVTVYTNDLQLLDEASQQSSPTDNSWDSFGDKNDLQNLSSEFQKLASSTVSPIKECDTGKYEKLKRKIKRRTNKIMHHHDDGHSCRK